MKRRSWQPPEESELPPASARILEHRPQESWRPEWTREQLLEWAREHGVPLYGPDE